MPSTIFTSAVATPGTPQRLTSGASPALPTVSGMLSGTITPRARFLSVTADPGNTASKYVWIGGSSLSVSGNSGWSHKLAPGATVQIALADQAVDIGDFWVDTDGTTAKYAVEAIG